MTGPIILRIRPRWHPSVVRVWLRGRPLAVWAFRASAALALVIATVRWLT